MRQRIPRTKDEKFVASGGATLAAIGVSVVVGLLLGSALLGFGVFFSLLLDYWVGP